MEQTSQTLGLLGKAQLQCKDCNSLEVLNCSHPSYQSQAGAPYPMVVMLGQLLWQILEMETCIMTYRLVMEFTKHFITDIFCSIRSTFFLWRIIGMHPTTICTPDSNRVMKCSTEWIFLMSHPLPCYDAYIPQWDQTITHPANVAFLAKVIFEVQAVLVSPFT